MVLLRTVALAAGASLVAAQSGQIKCSPSSKCPSSAPCCSSYGICGTGAYCLGGCDPKSSLNLQSCMPAPVCSSGDFKFTSLDSIQANTEYLGDATQANWVSSGTPAIYQNEALLLTMPPNTVGTLVSSTHYVWYGKIGATLTTSQGAGVVTAFIMMSDMKDEIDFEFVGVDTEHAQSNFYWQGVTDYDNEMNLTVSNTAQNSHLYEVDWQPDQLTWSIDGNVMRTLKKSDTYNETDKQYHYPQTPARAQLSLWPAGLASNGQGTIDWAGGLVDWNSPYMKNGYYYALVNEVTIDCYDAPSDAQVAGSKAYEYTDVLGTENTVKITNDNTVLASFQANGNNQQLGAKPSGTTSASTSSAAAATSSAAANDNTVPGMSGAGSYSNSAQSSSDGSDSADGTSSSSGSSSSGTSSGSGSASSGSSSSGFSQGTTGSSKSESHRVVAGSIIALVAFIAATMMM